MGKRLPLGLFDATVHHIIEIPQLDAILGAIGTPSQEWKEKIEEILMAVKVDLNKLRRGLDKFQKNEEERKRLLLEKAALLQEKADYVASEEVEDREADLYRAQMEEYKTLSEAEKATLRRQIAELEARPASDLSDEERTRLNGMIEELAAAVNLEEEIPPTDPAPDAPVDTPAPVDNGPVFEPLPDAPVDEPDDTEDTEEEDTDTEEEAPVDAPAPVVNASPVPAPSPR